MGNVNAGNAIKAIAPINVKECVFSESDEAIVLADIYQELCNMVIWRRQLSSSIVNAVDDFLRSEKEFFLERSLSPETAFKELSKVLKGSEGMQAVAKDISDIVEMFCSLFELKQVGLRLAVLDQTMCPRFHADKVPCRLITTYRGSATEWLPEEAVDRTKLGRGNNGLPDELSGIYRHADDIQNMNNGDVGLLKGELWEGNENTGLVHRSPSLSLGEQRLLLTLDFVA